MQIKEFYQSRKSQRNLKLVVTGDRVPLYGGGASLTSVQGKTNGTVPPVPLSLAFTVRARAYVLGKLVKPKFYVDVQCNVNMDQTKLNKPVSLKNKCQVSDWESFDFSSSSGYSCRGLEYSYGGATKRASLFYFYFSFIFCFLTFCFRGEGKVQTIQIAMWGVGWVLLFITFYRFVCLRSLLFVLARCIKDETNNSTYVSSYKNAKILFIFASIEFAWISWQITLKSLFAKIANLKNLFRVSFCIKFQITYSFRI